MARRIIRITGRILMWLLIATIYVGAYFYASTHHGRSNPECNGISHVC